MSIAESEFWSRLVQSGLADTAGCQRAAVAFRNSNPRSASDVDALAGFLIKQGVLNPFQADRLLAGGDAQLRAGGFVITSDQPIRPFTHWIPVQTPVGNDLPPTRRGFLLRVPLQGLDESRRSWLAVHSEIRSKTLQPIELSGGAQSGDSEQMVEIFSPMPEGASLWTILQSKKKLSPRKTVRIGVDVARALQQLHSPGQPNTTIAHAAVAADHLWVTSKGHAVLLRDPSSGPRHPTADQSTSWIERIELPAQYAAPELADPSVAPSPASDIYSLGCVLFSVLVGRPPFIGADARQLIALHQHDTPTEITQAVALGAEGNPILRVIAYAMAKDPAARFATAAAFADALQKAGELIDGRESDSVVRLPAESAPAVDPVARETNVSPAKTAPASVPKQAPKKKPEPVSPVGPTPEIRVAEDPKPTKRSKRAKRTKPVPPTPDESTPTPPTPPATEATAATENHTTRTGKQASTATSGGEPTPVESTPTDRPRRRRKRKKNRVPILAGIMVLPVLLLGLAIVLRGRGPQEPAPRPRPAPGVVRNVPVVPDSRRDVAEPAGPERVNGFEIVDSERLLWVPPYPADSASPSLALLPPGPAAIVSVRVAAIHENASAQPIFKTFGAELDPLIERATQRAGVERGQIERCTAALFPGSGGWPEVALAIELVEPMELDELSERWGAAESRAGEATLFAGDDLDGDAYFIGDGDNGKLADGAKVRRFAVASLDRIREIAETGGSPIPLVRTMQTLWDQASDQSHFVALVTPNFLFADGRQLLATSLPEIQRPARRALIPNVAGLSISASVDDSSLYFEMRQLPSGATTAPALLQAVRADLDAWPAWADNFIVDSVPDSSWRLLANRLPMMLRFVGEQTRSTILDQTVVTATYLPVDAGTQVALGTFLAMNTAPGQTSVAQSSGSSSQSLTVDEMLDRPMSVSFLQLSLQFAVDAVVDEFSPSLPDGSTMPKVRIIGGDLEKNGITQNQQIRGFERNDKPLRGVLTDLLLGANPDKTATGPKDPKQSLVWVVHPVGKPPEETEILITTRDAAEGRYELPEEFRPEASSE